MDLWTTSLVKIAKVLNKNKIPFILVASGSLKVLGIDIKPNDIDIFTTEENVKKCFELFKSSKTTNLHHYKDKSGKYLEFQAELDNVLVEFCELESLDERNIQKVEVGGTTIAIPKDTVKTELQKNIRKGNIDRVKAIKRYIKQSNKTNNTLV